MCTKNVRLPRAENAMESARIRWKRVVSTAEAVSCRGSGNHPLLLPRQRGKAPVAENQCDARGPKTQGNQHGYGEKDGFHAGEPVSCRGSRNRPLLLPRQREKGPVAANRSDAHGPKTLGNQHGYGGKGWFPRPKQSPAAAAEITPLLLPRQRGKAPVAENRSDARGPKTPGNQHGYGEEDGFHTREPVSCRGSRNRPLLLPRQREKNCGALRVLCTAGVQEGAMSLRYIGG